MLIVLMIDNKEVDDDIAAADAWLRTYGHRRTDADAQTRTYAHIFLCKFVIVYAYPSLIASLHLWLRLSVREVTHGQHT